jgi:cytochrome c biogenesis factor
MRMATQVVVAGDASVHAVMATGDRLVVLTVGVILAVLAAVLDLFGVLVVRAVLVVAVRSTADQE